MRQHHFQLRDLNGRDGLICISSKYALYQGLSNKVMQALRRERLKTQLQLMCINKAWDLSQFDNKTLRRQFNINVERTSRELAGEYYISLTEDVEPKQMIACTRSFSERVTSYQELRTAISTFVANASRKLREQRQFAGCVQVFVRTSPFDTKGMQYGRSVRVPMTCPTYDTRGLLASAVAGLQQIYIEGPKYAKAGVILSQFFDAGMFTDDLFAQPTRKNTEQLMAVLDRINMTHGRGSVRFASEPAVASWHMKQQLLSPQYTTQWTDVMRVNA